MTDAAPSTPPSAPPASSPSSSAIEEGELVTIALICFGIGMLSACGICGPVAMCQRCRRRAVKPRVLVRFAGPPAREPAFDLGSRLAAAHSADPRDGSITMQEWKTGRRPWAPLKPSQRRPIAPAPATTRPTAPPAPAGPPSSAEIVLKELRRQELALTRTRTRTLNLMRVRVRVRVGMGVRVRVRVRVAQP